MFAYSTRRTIPDEVSDYICNLFVSDYLFYLDNYFIYSFMHLFELVCGLKRRSDGFLHTDSALALKMINPKVSLLLIGKLSCTIVLASWVIYKELAILPDKIASYLYEFHAESYASHGLPPLPVDRSIINVHGILRPQQVCILYLFSEIYT